MCLCRGCYVFCLYCDAWSCRCSCMGNMSVSSCRCCMFVSWVQFVTDVTAPPLVGCVVWSHNKFVCIPFPQTPHYYFPEFTIIFPPLLPTITLDISEFTFSPLSRRLALYQPHINQAATLLIPYSIPATRKTDHFLPQWRQQQTAVDSVWTLDRNQSSLQNSQFPKQLFQLQCKPLYTML